MRDEAGSELVMVAAAVAALIGYVSNFVALVQNVTSVNTDGILALVQLVGAIVPPFGVILGWAWIIV